MIGAHPSGIASTVSPWPRPGFDSLPLLLHLPPPLHRQVGVMMACQRA